MVYRARDDEELDAVLSVTEESLAFARSARA